MWAESLASGCLRKYAKNAHIHLTLRGNSAKSASALLPGGSKCLGSSTLTLGACSWLCLAMKVKERLACSHQPSPSLHCLGFKKESLALRFVGNEHTEPFHKVATVSCRASLPLKQDAGRSRKIHCVPHAFRRFFFFFTHYCPGETWSTFSSSISSAPLFIVLFWLFNRTYSQPCFCSVYKLLRVDSIQGCQVSNNANGKSRLVMLKASQRVSHLLVWKWRGLGDRWGGSCIWK